MKHLVERLELIVEGVYDKGTLKVVFMAGPAGSGKSTKARELFGAGKLPSLSASGMRLIDGDSLFVRS